MEQDWAGAIGALYGGIKIKIDPYCYETKTMVRGLADKRRPNNKKMLYRKVRIQIPTAYWLRDQGLLVCHPEWWKTFEAKARQRAAFDCEQNVRVFNGQFFPSQIAQAPQIDLQHDLAQDWRRHLWRTSVWQSMLTMPIFHTSGC